MARLVLVAVLSLLVAAPVAEAKVYDVPAELGSQLRRVAKRTDVPVRVPRRIDLDFAGRTYASGTGSRRSWSLSLAGAPDCGGASACFLARFSGQRAGRPALRRTVELANGITGYYKPMACGASCSPAVIEWFQRRVLYTIEAKVGAATAEGQQRAMVRAANSAIRARPR